MTDALTPHEAFRQLALDLGAADDDDAHRVRFGLTVEGQLLRAHYDYRTKNAPEVFRVRADARGPVPALSARRERGTDALGKALGVSREVQLGSADIDAAVYLETDAEAPDVQAALKDRAAQRALRDLVQAGYQVRLDGSDVDAILSPVDPAQLAELTLRPVLAALATLARTLAPVPAKPAAPQPTAAPVPGARPGRKLIRREPEPEPEAKPITGRTIAWWIAGGGVAVSWLWLFGTIQLITGTGVDKPWGLLFALAGGLWLLGMIGLGLLVRGRHDSMRTLIWLGIVWLVPSLLFGLTVPHALNRRLDRSPRVQVEYVIVRMGGRGKNPHSDAKLITGSRTGRVVSLPGRVPRGTRGKAYARSGRFGWVWLIEDR